MPVALASLKQKFLIRIIKSKLPCVGNDKKYCLILFLRISPASDRVESDCCPNSGKLADNIIAENMILMGFYGLLLYKPR